ncbi:MAG: metallophosphoesterase [Solirubrobacterales bacterium]|nr:metallophosphoesterase [Solirubrobacterales bacterium]
MTRRLSRAVLSMVGVFLLAGLAPDVPIALGQKPVVVWAVGDGPSPYAGTRALQVANFLQSEAPFNDLLWLGDIYDAPSDKAFDELYGPTYGRFAEQTYPTPGNHELKPRRPLGPYDDYWERHRPAVVGHKIDGNPSNLYAADLGQGWRLLGLTSSFVPPDFSPAAPNPPHPAVEDVLEFLHRELSTHTGTCYIAIMHRPRYSAGGRQEQNTDLQPIWQELAGRVDLYVQGHEHEYFRLDPSKIPDYYPTSVRDDNDINKQLVPGAQSFVVGTGGITLDYLGQPGQMFDTNFPGLESFVVAPNAAAKLDLAYYGALRLSLTNGHSSYEFVGLDGSVHDRGTTTCTPVATKHTGRTSDG